MTFRESIIAVAGIVIGGMTLSAICVFLNWNMWGGVHGVGADTTYSYDTSYIELPVTESKDIAGQRPDTVVLKEVIERWRALGYDTTFIVLRDTIIKRIEKDPFSLVLAFKDSLKWRNNLTVVLPQGREDIKDSGYVHVSGYADFLSGKVHINPIQMSPFKAVTVSRVESIVTEKRDWLSVSLYAEKGIVGSDTDWQFGARARVYLGDIVAYVTGDMDGNLTPGSKLGVEYKLLNR